MAHSGAAARHATTLGTATVVPSWMLQLAGSPSPNQIDVQYAAYAADDQPCCPSLPSVVLTYTFDSASMTVASSGTAPGH